MRVHGKDGRLYAGIGPTGTAEPIAYLDQWTLSLSVDRAEVTGFDDENKTYLAGKPDAQGTYKGHYDNATAQTYTAATDGIARKMYLYPDRTGNGQYFFGTATLDYNIDTSHAAGVGISGTFAASSKFQKVG